MTDRQHTIVFTDGSSKGNPGPGGWGAIIVSAEGHVTELFEAGGERRARLALTTKDQHGEIKLAGEAVVALP